MDKNHIDKVDTATSVGKTLLDFDIQESVSKLESDITKTIENNNNKLKELEHMLHEEKNAKHSIAQAIDDDAIVPIVETISDDMEIVTKPASVEKVEEDYVVEDVSLLKKLIAETGSKEDANVETLDNDAVETATVDYVTTTEKPIIVETTTENVIQTTVTLVNTLTTTIKVRLF